MKWSTLAPTQSKNKVEKKFQEKSGENKKMLGTIFNKLKLEWNNVDHGLGHLFTSKKADKVFAVFDAGWNKWQKTIKSISFLDKLQNTVVKIINFSLVKTVKITSKFSKNIASTVAQFSHVPINAAILNRDMKTVDILLEAGFQINSISPLRVTPLIMAALNLGSDVVSHLIEKGGNPNYPWFQRFLKSTSNQTIFPPPVFSAAEYNPQNANLLFVATMATIQDLYLMLYHHEFFTSDRLLFTSWHSFKHRSSEINIDLVQHYIHALGEFIRQKMEEATKKQKKLLILFGESHAGLESYVMMIAILYLMQQFQIKHFALEGNIDLSSTLIQGVKPLYDIRMKVRIRFLAKHVSAGMKYTPLESGIHKSKIESENTGIDPRDIEMANGLQSITEHCFATVGTFHLKGIMQQTEKLKEFLICPIVSENEDIVFSKFFRGKALAEFSYLNDKRIAKLKGPYYLHVHFIKDFKKIADDILELEPTTPLIFSAKITTATNNVTTSTATTTAITTTSAIATSTTTPALTATATAKTADITQPVTISFERSKKREKLSPLEITEVASLHPNKVTARDRLAAVQCCQ